MALAVIIIPTLAFVPLKQQCQLSSRQQCDDKTTTELAASLNRRDWLNEVNRLGLSAFVASSVVTSCLFSSPQVASAASTSFKNYDDPVHGFSIDVPDSWEPSTQQLPDRRKIQVWTDPTTNENGKSLIFVAYTPVRDDFTSLASFGSVDQVAMQTILPKGQIAGEDVKASMLSATSKNQAYFFDYKQEVPGVQPETHMRSIFALEQGATGGAGAVLVTVTAQTPEVTYQQGMKDVFDHVIGSFGKTKGTGST